MASDMFMKIDDLKGDAIDAAKKNPHAGEIKVISFHWGMSQQGSSHLGAGSGTGRADVQDLSFTHYIDSASPNLMKFCCSGKHFKEAMLTVRKAGGDAVEYLKISLKDVSVSGVTTGAPGPGDLLTETISLHFAKFSVEYTPQEGAGSGSGAASIKATWNVVGNVESI